jgi:hypothetical protein
MQESEKANASRRLDPTSICARPGEKGRFSPALLNQLLLLLALGMRRVGLLVRRLRMLLRTGRVLLALGVVALAMMFGGGTVRLGGVFVMFGCLVVLVFGHETLVGWVAPSRDELAMSGNVPTNERP